jgi:hypothetical protein
MLLGMKESYKKGESESILAPSLAVVAVRQQLKRSQVSVGRTIELRKTLIGALNSISDREGNTADCVRSQAIGRPCVV